MKPEDVEMTEPIEPTDVSLPGRSDPTRRRRALAEIGKEAALTLPNVVKLLVRMTRDPRVAVKRKVLAAAVLVYIVSPIDLIPDLLPGLGKVDDVILAALVVGHLLAGSDRELLLEHWDGSEEALDLLTSTLAWSVEIVPTPVRRVFMR